MQEAEPAAKPATPAEVLPTAAEEPKAEWELELEKEESTSEPSEAGPEQPGADSHPEPATKS